ncbi:hypothetical protein TNCV_1455011 [Trichonephila clavipes]|nr:hypothetical protein TNCV_1455011 [Trichonephila clavipes]
MKHLVANFQCVIGVAKLKVRKLQLNEELPVGRRGERGSVPTDGVGGKRTIEEGDGEPVPSSRRRSGTEWKLEFSGANAEGVYT